MIDELETKPSQNANMIIFCKILITTFLLTGSQYCTVTITMYT